MKIYILDAFHRAGVDYAAQHAEVVRWDDPRVGNWAEDADGVMVRMTPIRAADLARAKKLKIICKQGVGVDTIDLEAAKARGIPVSRTPGVNSEAVAELALALGLAATRRVGELDRLVRAGAKIERPKFLGVEMLEKTVGVIGCGNIGSRVAHKWRGAFNARIVAYDPYVSNLPFERKSRLEDLLPEADLLVNCTSIGRGDPAETFKALPLAADSLDEFQCVVDSVYRDGETALLAEARLRGTQVVDGIEILVRQGALSLERWTGRPAPLDVMRAAARGG